MVPIRKHETPIKRENVLKLSDSISCDGRSELEGKLPQIN